MRTKFGIKKHIGLNKKTSCFKNSFKSKNLSGEKFHLFLNKELKICVTVDIGGFLSVPKTETGPKINNRMLLT